jgi:hypothetical protein
VIRHVIIAACMCLVTATVRAADREKVVRNDNPQRAARPVEVEWPIYDPNGSRIVTVIAPEDDTPPDVLLARMMDRHAAMKYDEALAIGETLIALAPDQDIVHFNTACALCRLRRLDEALDALGAAVECGWRNTLHMVVDHDLEPLWDDVRFKELVRDAETRRRAESIAPGPMRDGAWEQAADELAHLAPALMERHHVPGMAVALIWDGEVAWSSGFGDGDRRSAQPMTDRTLFPLTAPRDLLSLIAIAQLSARDQLDVDALLAEAAQTGGNRSRGVPASTRPRKRGGNLPPGIDENTFPGAGGPVVNLSRNRNTGEPRAIGWRRPNRTDRASKLIDLAIEMNGGMTAPRWFEQHILLPVGFERSLFMTPADDAGGASVSAGHTRFGTPIAPGHEARSRDGIPLHVCAVDLARLIAALMPELAPGTGEVVDDDGESDPPISREAIERLHHIALHDPPRLGLAVHAEQTDACGLRLQVADVDAGLGCLLRWYPEHRRGVVIMFNGETGDDAALRLAQRALGGS